MLIAHAADIHIRSLSRHDEVKSVTEAFIDDVTKKKVDAIYIAGDIYHTKTQNISPEYIDFMSWWLKSLADAAPVHFILGNHDGICSNACRQDAVSPIIDLLGNPRIHMYKKSGVYEFERGFNWCVFSVFDLEGWKNVYPEPDQVNIACYHGPVAGAKLDIDWKVESEMTSDFFSEYTCAMLGDIHRKQFLSEREQVRIVDGKRVNVVVPNVAYPGSFMQNSYGESIEHGYLLWDIKDNSTYDVSFVELPNDRPYVTVPWQGSAAATIAYSQGKFPAKSRVRISSHESLRHKEAVNVTHELKNALDVSEVTFKCDDVQRSSVIAMDTMVLKKDDLRSVDVLVKLLKEFHANADVNDDEWESTSAIINANLVAVNDQDVLRNTSWSLKRLEFDNTFAYGEGNFIEFDALRGIVGVFGPNRIGKSSLVGSLTYALFNGTDRGCMKNVHIINARKPYCLARCVLNVGGQDYVIERQTTKTESKKGVVYSNTALNVFRIVNGELVDLNGEQRYDTEKVIRKLIGTFDDFVLTSLSAQDDLKLFINHGSTKRRQIVVRFLDLDVFQALHGQSKEEINIVKGLLKGIPERDWSSLEKSLHDKIVMCDDLIEQKTLEHDSLRDQIDSVKRSLDQCTIIPVRSEQVKSQRATVRSLEEREEKASLILGAMKNQHETMVSSIDVLSDELKSYDVDDLKRRSSLLVNARSTIEKLRHACEKEQSVLRGYENSTAVLDTVPCGDEYPTCRFIKDAYAIKGRLDEQRKLADDALNALNVASNALEDLEGDEVDVKLERVETLGKKVAKLHMDAMQRTIDINRLETALGETKSSLIVARDELSRLERAFDSAAIERVNSLKNDLATLIASAKEVDDAKVAAAKDVGRAKAAIDKCVSDKKAHSALLQRMKCHELIVQAFSRHGVPGRIIAAQLPIINGEIASILQGIVDFVIELESDEESDSLDVYINYGDSRRIIELASGMEKMIASIAIRVALINVSTLPKTDFFIIDEGFSALDESGIEACNRLLTSLKRYFKSIIVVTHVDGIKDVADTVIEIFKNEKDASVQYG
jgi:DNA repair exonuclease SbcCD ATPase subunit